MADGSGDLTKQELDEALENEQFTERLKHCKISKGQLHGLFDLLDVHDKGVVDQREFIESMLGATGPTTKKDMLGLSLLIRQRTNELKAEADCTRLHCRARVERSHEKFHEMRKDAEKVVELLEERRRRLNGEDKPPSVLVRSNAMRDV